MTLVQLHHDSFIRFFRGFAFLVNQRTKVDHIFNERELPYLRPISRSPQPVEVIVRSLEAALPTTDRLEIRRNFSRLLRLLEAERFLVTGESPRELEQKSQAIYRDPVRIPGKTPVGVPLDSALYCNAYFNRHPTVFAMQVDLTSRCNERCLHCYYPPGRIPTTLETSLACDVLDQLPELGTLSMTFSGGEPFLHPDLETILHCARKNDLTITIQTNATLLDSERIAMLREVNVNTVQVSLYSLVEADHDAVTGTPGSFRKTMAALEKLHQAGIPLYVSTHIMKPNRHSYRTVLEWGVLNGIKVVTDFIMLARTDFSTDNLDNRLDLAATEEVMREMLSWGNEFGKSDEQRVIDPASFAQRSICGVGIDSISLASSGHYYPCSGFIGYDLGDARKVTLSEVWHHSPKLQGLREMRWGDFPGCLSCDAFQFCSMCLARNYNENGGDLRAPVRQNCEVSFLNRRVMQERWSGGCASEGACAG